MMTSRGYKCVYLLSYSAELNVIERSWSIVTNIIKRNKFNDKEDLGLTISDGCSDVPIRYLKAII